MSKHVWQTAPTSHRAGELDIVYRYCLSRGCVPDTARVFAGYWLETVLQAGRGDPRSDYPIMYEACERSGWRVLRGKNADNYRLAFFRHNIYWLGGVDVRGGGLNLASALYDGDFSACGPLYDWLQEHGHEAAAFYYQP